MVAKFEESAEVIDTLLGRVDVRDFNSEGSTGDKI